MAETFIHSIEPMGIEQAIGMLIIQEKENLESLFQEFKDHEMPAERLDVYKRKMIEKRDKLKIGLMIAEPNHPWILMFVSNDKYKLGQLIDMAAGDMAIVVGARDNILKHELYPKFRDALVADIKAGFDKWLPVNSIKKELWITTMTGAVIACVGWYAWTHWF